MTTGIIWKSIGEFPNSHFEGIVRVEMPEALYQRFRENDEREWAAYRILCEMDHIEREGFVTLSSGENVGEKGHYQNPENFVRVDIPTFRLTRKIIRGWDEDVAAQERVGAAWSAFFARGATGDRV